MARDYKHRAQPRKKPAQTTGIAWWRWLTIAVLIGLFVFFLNYLGHSVPATDDDGSATASLDLPKIKKPKKEKTSKTAKPRHQDEAPDEPRYDFYTILPEAEVVVPDYEIKTRAREERVGKAKPTRYMIQAGSFREFAQADKLRAQLALMGIESRVEKARVGNVVWNRVKMGPYSNSSSVASIKERLRKNGIDVIVTEQEG